MTLRAALALAMFAGASLMAPAASAADIAQTGALPHGGTYLVARDATLAAASIDLWFRAPGAGYDNNAPGIARLAATAAAAAKLESGKSLVELVHSVGGRLAINVYPDIVGVSVLVPSSASRRIVAAMSAAYFAPSIDETALKSAQRDAAVLAVLQRYSSDQILHNALFAAIFSGGPAHYAPLPDQVSELTRVPLTDVVGFAHRAFRSANAFLTLAGNVDSDSLDAITSGTPGSPDAPVDSTLASAPAADSTLTATVSGVGVAWAGPAIHDARAATAMDFIADYLFRENTGVVAKDVRDDAYVNGQFVTLHDPGVMVVTIGGAKAEELQAKVLAAVDALSHPMDAKQFEAAREAFLFHLASDTQNPSEQADNLGWYAAEGNPQYAPGQIDGNYWTFARSLDASYIASVVKQYLSHPVVVKLVPTAKESSS